LLDQPFYGWVAIRYLENWARFSGLVAEARRSNSETRSPSGTKRAGGLAVLWDSHADSYRPSATWGCFKMRSVPGAIATGSQARPKINSAWKNPATFFD